MPSTKKRILKATPVFIREYTGVALFTCQDGGQSTCPSLSDAVTVSVDELANSVEYVFPVAGLEIVSSQACLNPEFVPKEGMSPEEFLEQTRQLALANEQRLKIIRRKLGMNTPGAPKKYNAIQQARKRVLAELHLPESVLRNSRARSKAIRDHTSWEELFAMANVPKAERGRARKAVIKAEHRLYDAPFKVRRQHKKR